LFSVHVSDLPEVNKSFKLIADLTPDRMPIGEFVNIEKSAYEKLLHGKIPQVNPESSS
jgi:hypothetical protein